MEMTCYEFRDRRRIFKWIYLYVLLSAVEQVIYAVSQSNFTSLRSFIFVFFIVLIIVFRKTRKNIYVDDKRVKIKTMIPYTMIDKIEVKDNILIQSGSRIEEIKIIDIENNFDKYKELLEVILSNVNERVAESAGSAEALLQTYQHDLSNRYRSQKLANGKVMLGGWLAFFNVIAYMVVISMPFMVVSGLVAYFTSEGQSIEIDMIINTIIMFAFELIVIILISKRKNKVKYFLPMSAIVLAVIDVVAFIIGAITQFVFLDFTLGLLYLAFRCITIYLMCKIYIEYIDTFERPKQTLTN